MNSREELEGDPYYTRAKDSTELQTIYDEAPIGLAVIGIDFRFLRINNFLAKINGLPVEAHLGRRVREVLPALADFVEQTILTITRTGQAIRNIEVAGETPSCPGVIRNFVEHWSPLKCPNGHVIAVNVVVEEVTAKLQAERLLQEKERRLNTALRLGRLGVFEHTFSPNPGYYWDEGYREIFGVSQTEPITDITFWSSLHPDDISHVREFTESIHSLTAQDYFETEHRIVRASDRTERWIALSLYADRCASGVRKVVGTIQDITERKLSSERDRFLVREMNHRSKNLLAVVQAMATQTLKKSPVENFANDFGDRLRSLSTSHDLVVVNDWRGVALDELIRSQLAPFQSLFGQRIHLSGPHLMLSAPAAQNLGLALHELATNAVKYGSLSNTNGEVTIEWNVSDDVTGTQFILQWVENKGPLVKAPSRSGFGTLVTTRALESSLNGVVSLEYEKLGLRWLLKADLATVAAEVVS